MAKDSTAPAVNNEMITLEGGHQEPGPTTLSTAMLEQSDNLSAASSNEDHDEMGVRHCFYDFCKQTILHGWRYLADSEHDSSGISSTSFVTFTPEAVSSPSALASQVQHPLTLHNTQRGRSRSSSPPTSTSRSRSRSNSHHHVTLNARASGSGHANVSITHHHHCCSCSRKQGQVAGIHHSRY